MAVRILTPVFVLLGALLLPTSGRTLLAPPEGDGGSGCLECGELTIIRPDGTMEEKNTCVSAPFAAPLSGKTCQVIDGDCKIQDYCYFA